MQIRPNDMVMFIKPVEVQSPSTGEWVTVVRCGAPNVVGDKGPDGHWKLENPIHCSAVFPSGGHYFSGILVSVAEDYLMPIRPDGLVEDEHTEVDLEVPA